MKQDLCADAPKVLQVLTRLGAGGPPLSVILTTRHLNLLGYSTRLVTGRCDHVDLDMSYLLDPSDPVEWVEEMSRSVSIKNDLLALAQSRPHTAHIKTFLFHPAFPVDIRHNAKIFREKLAVWAARKLA